MGAVVIAGPVGVCSALFSQFYAPVWLRSCFRRIVALLNGIPSVVFGFWGLVVLVPLINQIQTPGQSLIAGILVLSLMVLPTIVLTADAALQSVPPRYLDAAAATGLGRSAVILNIALPSARDGILAGLVLAAARAIGETMAVVMVCGNIVQVPDSIFSPVRTITANIALEMGYAQAEHRSAMFVTGLALLMLVALLLLLTGSIRFRRAVI
jgi:phosphate transport system permease protein